MRHFLLVPFVVGVAMMTGACGAPLLVTAGSYAADGGLLATTEKTSTDHLASMVTKKDCAMLRVFRGASICRERDGEHDPYDVNYDEVYRSPSEGGTQYGPPLRSTGDAPAASWDAASYTPPQPVPAPPHSDEPTTTAVADVAPQAAVQPPAAQPAPSPKSSARGKTARRVTKASRGQVAPAP